MSDIVDKLAHLKKLFEPIQSLNKAGKDVQRSFEACERAARSGVLTGDDEATIMADAVARHFDELLRDVLRWDENKWIAQTSYNSLNPASHAPAIAELRRDRDRIAQLADAFVGLAALLKVKRVSDLIDVKKLAKAWVPSLIAINEIHRQDVITRYNSLAERSRAAVVRLDTVLKAIEKPARTSATIPGFNFSTLRSGQVIVNRVPLLRQAVFKFPAFCRLTTDIPSGTPFVVGGVQTVEKWFDAEARNLVGLKLRLSAEEGARLFTQS